MIDITRENRNIRLALLASVTNGTVTAANSSQYEKTGVGRSGYMKAISTLVERGHLIATEGGYTQTESGYRAAMDEVSQGPSVGDGPRLAALYSGIESCVMNASFRSIPVAMVIVEWYYR